MPDPHPGEFWQSASGEPFYVERYDRYLCRLIVVDEHGAETERDVNGRVPGSRTYDDLVRPLVGCTSFPQRKREHSK
jgi:hypothetical protein